MTATWPDDLGISVLCPECEGSGEIEVCNPGCRHAGDLYDDRVLDCVLCDRRGVIAG